MLEQIQSLESTGSNKKFLFLAIGAILVFIIFVFGYLESENREVVTAYVSEEGEVETTAESSIYVDMSGAVNAPGVYELDTSSRVIDAIEKAGGITTLANHEWVTREINLSSKLYDSQKIYIPFEWEGVESNPLQIAVFADIETESNAVENSDSGINVNSASLEELDSLSGVGPVFAQKIIDSRPYANIDEFEEKSGLSESLISKIQDEIKF